MSNNDPLVFAAVTGVTLITGLIACAMPARRAMDVNPVVALREE